MMQQIHTLTMKVQARLGSRPKLVKFIRVFDGDIESDSPPVPRIFNFPNQTRWLRGG